MQGSRFRSIALMAAVVALAVLVGAGAARAATTKYGDLEFPKDEHQHVTGWDYWWGAANLVTRSGNRYTVGLAFDGVYGYGGAGHEVFPLQGPYKGETVTSMNGPEQWGNGSQQPGRFVSKMSVYTPGVTDLLSYRTFDTSDSLKQIGAWERTTMDGEKYHLRLDEAQARVHPTGQQVKLVTDLDVDMKSPPLLAGGTGTWWYGIPQTYGYPSRSFQYMQAAKRLTGTLDLEQPDGTVLHEKVVPGKSTLLMTHEYDATPEDLFAGLALAQSSQLHPRYAPYYQGGMPWELVFVDLDNGAQLMLAVLAFQDAKDGTIKPVTAPGQPTYEVQATLRLPNGRSVPVDDIHVEHLSYRTIAGLVPTFDVNVNGIWKQAWDYRVSYGGGTVTAPDGKRVHVPPFDLGVVPQIGKDEPKLDDRGQGLTQRVPFDASGSYGGCPVHGFGWSELIINWYGREDEDPWFTGGEPPPVPAHCGADQPAPPSGTFGNLAPPPNQTPYDVHPEPGCTASDPSTDASCSYDATVDGGIGAYGNAPGDWTVTIAHPGDPDPLVVKGFGGQQMYDCSTIRPGDHVEVETKPGAFVAVGNPGVCF